MFLKFSLSWSFPTKIYLLFMRESYTVQLGVIHLLTQIIFGKEY